LLNILVPLATVFEEETTNLFAKIKDKNKKKRIIKKGVFLDIILYCCPTIIIYFDACFYTSTNKSKPFRFLVYYLLLIFYSCGFVLETFERQKVDHTFMQRKFIVR
jgi:hypothetical protein